MTRDRSEMGRALASIDQQIGELQRARQILLDARRQREIGILLDDAPKRRRRTKADMAVAEAGQS